MSIMRKLDNAFVIITYPAFISSYPDDTGVILIYKYNTILPDCFIIILAVKQVPEFKILFI